jgi:hypothetical protein
MATAPCKDLELPATINDRSSTGSTPRSRRNSEVRYVSPTTPRPEEPSELLKSRSRDDIAQILRRSQDLNTVGVRKSLPILSVSMPESKLVQLS